MCVNSLLVFVAIFVYTPLWYSLDNIAMIPIAFLSPVLLQSHVSQP